MSNQPSAERPLYIEQIRAEVRGLKYRPAKRKKDRPDGRKPAAPPDPDGNYDFSDKFLRAQFNPATEVIGNF